MRLHAKRIRYILVHNNARKLLVMRCLNISVNERNTMNPSTNANTSITSMAALLYWNMKKMRIATIQLMIAGNANSVFFLWSLITARKWSWNDTLASLFIAIGFFSFSLVSSVMLSTVLYKIPIKMIATRLIAPNRKKFACPRNTPITNGCKTKK